MDTRNKRHQTFKEVKHMDEDAKCQSPASDRVKRMPLELRQILDFDEEKLLSIHYLMDISDNLFLKKMQTTHFMKKHKLSTQKQEKLIENLKFSKNFFAIMDEDQSGSINLRELTYPLLSLGLANNSEFVQKALRMLNPRKFGNGNFLQEIN